MKKFLDIKNLVMFAMLIVWSSCEKTIPFEGENTTPKLVLNSFFSADSTLKVHMSNNLGIVDDGDLADVVNAEVILYNKDNQVEAILNHQGGGIYESAFKPTIGETYTIRASADDYEDVSASDQLLSRPDSLEVTVDMNAAGDIILTLFLKGNTLESNYYKLDVSSSGDPGFFFVNSVNFEVNGLIVDNDAEEMDGVDLASYREILFTDELNADGALSFTIKIKEDGNFGPPLSKLNINLTSCTSDYYQHYRTLRLYQSSDQGPFTEFVRVFSNVENGFGIFGGYNEVVSKIEL